MNGNDRKRLTLGERLTLAAQSRAASPEVAAAMVRRFAELPAVYAFCGKSDVEALFALTEDCWEGPRVDIDSYRRFCPVLLAAMEHDNDAVQVSLRRGDQNLRRPVWGTRVNNALVLLGEMLLDQAMGRRQRKEVYHCLRMTLGQYLEALAGPNFRRSAPEAERFLAWRERLLQEMDGNQPLAEALAGILRRYMAGWETFDRLDHVLRCLGGLALHVEEAGTEYHVTPCPDGDADEGGAALILEISRTEEAETARRFLTVLNRFGIGKNPDDLPKAEPLREDPYGYFLNLAQDYVPNLPDPSSEIKAKTLRGQIFLPDWQYGPGALRELAEMMPFPEFEPLLEECLNQDRLTGAIRAINTAVTDLYMLWVDPYLRIRK